MKTNITTALTALLVLTLASGCGWRLRGTGVVPPGIDSLHISARDLRSDLVKELSRSLRAADVTVVQNATDAKYSIVILDERSHQRTATVNASARISELQLSEEVEFLVLNNSGQPSLPPTTVSVERVFEYNENNVLATDDERNLLKLEMRRELVRQILNRLRQMDLTAITNAPAS